MNKINNISIIGGDKRQEHIKDYFASLGYNVSLSALPYNENLKIDEIKNSDAVILPLPVTKNENELNSATAQKFNIDEIIKIIPEGIPVFGGMIKDEISEKLSNKNCDIFDYFKREEITVMNVVPTVQGILKIILNNIDYTVNSSYIAVLGYGRIAKMTADVLYSLGAKITVSARKKSDIALAKAKSMNACFLNDFYACADRFSIIINTVPARIIDEKILKNLNKNCLIIDVASYPYGIDMKLAHKHGINAMICPSLPGKTAPVTAGKIIAEGIDNMMKEEGYA